ncbi:MAG: transcription elongation factor NusA [Fervidicoccaceae archaeon]
MSKIVKIPLDYICVKTGILCPRCHRLVESGKVLQEEIPVMKALIELEEDKDFKQLKDITYVRTIASRDLTVIIVKSGGVEQLLLKRAAKALSDMLGRRVQIVEQTGDLKKLASELLSPVRINGVNTVWLPDGSTEYIVRISRYELRSLPSKLEVLEEILSKMLGSPARIRAE